MIEATCASIPRPARLTSPCELVIPITQVASVLDTLEKMRAVAGLSYRANDVKVTADRRTVTMLRRILAR